MATPPFTITAARSDYRGNLADHHVRHRRHPPARLLQAPQRPTQPARIGRRRAALAGLVALGAGAAAACATGRPDTFAARFIVSGTPTVSVDWRASDVPPPTPQPAPRAAPTGPRAATSGTTLEATSPPLRARLAALAASGSPDAFLDVAAAYRAHGVDDRAFDYLAKGLATHPTHPALHDAIARQWRDWGLLDRALRHAHLAVRYGPTSPAAHTTLGTVLWAVGARGDAVDAFGRAAALAPHAGYARHNRCVAERALGRSPSSPCPPPGRTDTEVPGSP